MDVFARDVAFKHDMRCESTIIWKLVLGSVADFTLPRCKLHRMLSVCSSLCCVAPAYTDVELRMFQQDKSVTLVDTCSQRAWSGCC